MQNYNKCARFRKKIVLNFGNIYEPNKMYRIGKLSRLGFINYYEENNSCLFWNDLRDIPDKYSFLYKFC